MGSPQIGHVVSCIFEFTALTALGLKHMISTSTFNGRVLTRFSQSDYTSIDQGSSWHVEPDGIRLIQ